MKPNYFANDVEPSEINDRLFRMVCKIIRFQNWTSFELHAKIRRLFDQINAAKQVETLKNPPSNRLEKLQGNLKGYWSIRINIQWRIIFQLENGEAYNVDIVDYH